MFQFGSPSPLDLSSSCCWHRAHPIVASSSIHQSPSPLSPTNDDDPQSLALATTKTSSRLQQQQPILLDMGTLSADQLECLCLVLENCDNFDGLAHLLALAKEANATFVSPAHQMVLNRAKAVLLFHQEQYDEFRRHIRSNQFAQCDHPQMQILWNEAHYRETEQQRGKRLDPVSRYRVRKKNAFPPNIWDGEGTSYCFKKSARETLRKAYQQNPVPSQQQKAELVKKTQLSFLQVSNWFKNQRQRARQHLKQQEQLMNRRAAAGYEEEGDDEEEDYESDDGAESEEQFGGSQCEQQLGRRCQKREPIFRAEENAIGIGGHLTNESADDGPASKTFGGGWAEVERKEEEWQRRRKGNQNQPMM